MKSSLKELVYIGAMDDNSFLNHPEMEKYNSYHLYDALPNLARFTKGQAYYEHTKDEKSYLKLLRKAFGEYIRVSKNKLYFRKHNLFYTYNVKCEDIDLIIHEGCDLFIRGFAVKYRFVKAAAPKNILWSDSNFGSIHKLRNKFNFRIITDLDADSSDSSESESESESESDSSDSSDSE
jgi:hypothetical protein